MMDMNCPMMNMEGMGWMMVGAGLVWLLTIAFFVLAIAAFAKYLFGRRSGGRGEEKALG